MTDEDRGICWAIANRSVGSGYWTHEILLAGERWEHILMPALKAGRLFLGKFKEGSPYAQQHIRLVPGPPIPLALGWNVLRSGNVKPVLRPANPVVRILPTRPLYHLDSHGPLRLDRLGAAGIADGLSLDSSATLRALAALGENLRNLHGLPQAKVPAAVKAEMRPYQTDGFRWLQFLAANSLHGILADDMGLGKTLQTIAHLVAEHARKPGHPSLVIAPTSVVPNWSAEFARFAPRLKVLVLHGSERAALYKKIGRAQVVLTSYPLLIRDFEILEKQPWHVLALDEAQYIKNPKASTAVCSCALKAAHRLCLTGTPMQNHLGELWSLMRFLMPGLLGQEKTFATRFRRPIERDRSSDAQHALNRRVAPLILRRTKDDPWWNPAAEDQATDRAHRIGQNKPVFVHKLVCRGTIEERIQELQRHKAALVEALLTEDTAGLRIDPETLSHLLAPLG
jgi:hypothetical protein